MSEEPTDPIMKPLFDIINDATLKRVTPAAEMIGSQQAIIVVLIDLLLKSGAIERDTLVTELKKAADSLVPPTLAKRTCIDQLVTLLSSRTVQ